MYNWSNEILTSLNDPTKADMPLNTNQPTDQQPNCFWKKISICNLRPLSSLDLVRMVSTNRAGNQESHHTMALSRSCCSDCPWVWGRFYNIIFSWFCIKKSNVYFSCWIFFFLYDFLITLLVFFSVFIAVIFFDFHFQFYVYVCFPL